VRYVVLLALLGLSGCGSFLDYRCAFGTQVEIPCFCKASVYYGRCPPAAKP
jgi:hypothetical protein